ncbi:unnamed protein product [Pylaiella littoralis]
MAPSRWMLPTTLGMLFSLSAFLPSAEAGCCPNACSGHGTCTVDDACVCYSNWQNGEEFYETGDCSDRTCPYEIAWSDFPDDSGAHHTYAECANKGICDRTTGECVCFDGYEGKGCARMSCPNDCSGHGRCMFADDLPFGVNLGSFYSDQDNSTDHLGELGETNGNDAVTFTYYGWDEGKTRMCRCDPGYEGVDCSYRSCPEGNDVMVERLNRVAAVKYQKQAICLYSAGTAFSGTEYRNFYNQDERYWVENAVAMNFTGQTFALTFTSANEERFTTIPINLDGANTQAYTTAGYIDSALEGLPNGVIDSVQVDVNYNATGNVIAGEVIEEYPCDVLIIVTFDGMQVQGDQHLLEVEWRPCGDGCTPKLDGLPLSTIDTHFDNLPYTIQPHRSYVQQIQAADFESYVCGGRGKCDYTTGECACFTGYYGLHCETQTALI